MYKHPDSSRPRYLAAALTAMMVVLPEISMTADSPHIPRLWPDHISRASFGMLPDGAAVELYTLRNRHGMEARIATYGGIVTYLTARDRKGQYGDVVLGYEKLAGYLKESPYFGALIGRYGTSKSLGSRRHMQVTR